MGAGFLTSAVLQDFRDKKGVFGNAQTIWMSATLDRSLLNAHQLFGDAPVLSLEAEDWQDPELIKRLGRNKKLQKAKTVWKGYQAEGGNSLCSKFAARGKRRSPTGNSNAGHSKYDSEGDRAISPVIGSSA